MFVCCCCFCCCCCFLGGGGNGGGYNEINNDGLWRDLGRRDPLQCDYFRISCLLVSSACWNFIHCLQVNRKTKSHRVFFTSGQCEIHFTFTYSLTAGTVGAPQMTSQPLSSIFLSFQCPVGFGELQAYPFLDVVFPPLFLSPLSSFPFHCALQNGFEMNVLN